MRTYAGDASARQTDRSGSSTRSSSTIGPVKASSSLLRLGLSFGACCSRMTRLLAESIEDLQRMLDIPNEWTLEFSMNFNASKRSMDGCEQPCVNQGNGTQDPIPSAAFLTHASAAIFRYGTQRSQAHRTLSTTTGRGVQQARPRPLLSYIQQVVCERCPLRLRHSLGPAALRPLRPPMRHQRARGGRGQAPSLRRQCARCWPRPWSLQ
jgi:hypothetical protein